MYAPQYALQHTTAWSSARSAAFQIGPAEHHEHNNENADHPSCHQHDHFEVLTHHCSLEICATPSETVRVSGEFLGAVDQQINPFAPVDHLPAPQCVRSKHQPVETQLQEETLWYNTALVDRCSAVIGWGTRTQECGHKSALRARGTFSIVLDTRSFTCSTSSLACAI